ncbi:MAG: hypothetical protein ACC645_16520 [Pirellulales bacterium]
MRRPHLPLAHSTPPNGLVVAVLTFVVLASTAVDHQARGDDPATLVCPGFFAQHLQGVAASSEAIYWSFTDELVKTDLQGRLATVHRVKSHHGDLVHHDGRVYVAVNFGRFNDSQGRADSWIYVYRADDLAFVSKHATPQVIYGAGGIATDGKRFLVVGGLPADIDENYVYEYTLDLQFVGKRTLSSGQTDVGIQTAAFAQGKWWFGCYGGELLVADRSWKLIGKFDFDCSLGVLRRPDGRFWVGRGGNVANNGLTGKLVAAVADSQQGLVLVPRRGAEASDGK